MLHLSSALLRVPLSTANSLSYVMLVLVGVFLVFGPAIGYYYWRQSKKLKAAETVPASPPAAGH